jgi:hypothetical protein
LAVLKFFDWAIQERRQDGVGARLRPATDGVVKIVEELGERRSRMPRAKVLWNF